MGKEEGASMTAGLLGTSSPWIQAVMTDPSLHAHPSCLVSAADAGSHFAGQLLYLRPQQPGNISYKPEHRWI